MAGLIGQRLKYFRERAKLTQVELGARVSVRDATISRYEKGSLSISADALPLFAEAVGVFPRDFFEERQPGAAEALYEAARRIVLEAEGVSPEPATATRKGKAPAEGEDATSDPYRERAQRIARAQTAKLARRWEELTEEDQAAFWGWLDAQKEQPAEQEAPAEQRVTESEP